MITILGGFAEFEEAGEALIDIGRSYSVSHSTISRLAGAGDEDDR
jgi:hypothetical protein